MAQRRMGAMSGPFETAGPADVASLVEAMPLCWIVPIADPAACMLMPIVVERDGGGEPVSILGHLPRRAPTTATLNADGRALFLVLGPNRYISPEMAGRSDWAPTWNFASARISGHCQFDEELTRPAVEALTRQMEGPDGWTMDGVADRVDDLLSRVVGYRARIDRIDPRFKLGQDEAPDDFAAIVGAMGDHPLTDWMRRYGPLREG